MLDSKGRILGKVSIVDLFIVLMIAAIIPTFISRETPKPITMELSIDALEDFTVRFIEVGDSVLEHNSGVRLGSVVDINIDDSRQFSRNSEGQLVSSNLNNFYAVDITTEFMGYPLDNGILVEGHIFTVGEFMVTRVGGANLFLRISGITVGE